MQSSFPFDIPKPWGSFRQFNQDSKVTVKIISVNPNEILSLQSHAKRAEFWRVISGSGFVEIDGMSVDAREGDEFNVPKGVKHRFGTRGSVMQVLELSYGEFDEEDITRYEDKYGRAR